MRLSTFAAVLAAAGSISLASLPAEAQPFPSHMKNCWKEKNFLQEDWSIAVPAVGGGAGVVKVMSQNYVCTNSETRSDEGFDLVGMTDAYGKVLIPYKYAKVLPYSTTGALVIDHGKGPYPKNLKYRTYTVGKGESKEQFDFDALMLWPDGCARRATDATRGNLSAVAGVLTFNVGGGKSHVTLFTPEGKARKLEYMGGDGLGPVVRRVGDVLLVRWRDDQGAARTGILDVHGRQIAPVLSNSTLYVTPKAGLGYASVDGCDGVSVDLFIEGPSLDLDPAEPFFGPLLIPVARDGQPAALPRGAIGMFAPYRRDNTSGYADAPRNVSAMWAVVFPTQKGFEFTLHLGPPSEALIAAETGARYSTMARTRAYGGLVTAQTAADGKWITFRSDTDIAVGEANTDFDRNRDSAMAVLEAEISNAQQAAAAAWAKEEARRAADHKKHWELARVSNTLCQYRVSGNNTAAEVEEYILACGPGSFPGLLELARQKGVPSDKLQAATDQEWKRSMAQSAARAQWEEQARLDRARNANQDPAASYVPGQWESAIRNAGNAATEAINQSSDNWLQQRRDQYIADWQRSQRAY